MCANGHFKKQRFSKFYTDSTFLNHPFSSLIPVKYKLQLYLSIYRYLDIRKISLYVYMSIHGKAFKVNEVIVISRIVL